MTGVVVLDGVLSAPAPGVHLEAAARRLRKAFPA